MTILARVGAGSIVGVVLILAKGGDGKTRLPFGVFLAIGAIGAWFLADPLIARYRGLWP